MQLDTIFELVRKEDVVLWIGSGFSLYAGYPNGQKTAELIYNSLSRSEQDELRPNLPLMDLSEEFVRLKLGSRNTLLTLLRNTFLKSPQSTTWHEVLSNIPHIKTIVTTNYDRLFELAYKDEIHPIIYITDIAYRNGQTELFKVHGDINHPDSIIITRDDYANFFHRKTGENLIWTTIKERISNKSVVFIGYDAEDDNFKVFLKEINESLGANRKEMFLIAPDFKNHKIQHLAQYGIKYLDFKGEVFVKKLYENIKAKITGDFAKGLVSESTLRKFFQKNKLSVDLTATKSGFAIQSVKGLDSTPRGALSMNFKNDKTFLNAFEEFKSGKKFGKFVIDDTNLEAFQLSLNDINLIDDDKKNYQLIFQTQPHLTGTATVVFDDKYEFEDIQYQLFVSKLRIELKVKFKNGEFTVGIDNELMAQPGNEITSNLTYKQVDAFKSVNDAIAVNIFSMKIARGLGAMVYLDGDAKGTYYHPREVNLPIPFIESNLHFYESLKQVETYYQVRFSNISTFTEEDFDNVSLAILSITGKSHIQAWDNELSWEIQGNMPLELILKIEETTFRAESQTQEEVAILGQTIKLGYLVSEPQDLYITNLSDVMNGKSSIAKARSKTQKIKLYYVKETSSTNNRVLI